MRKTVLLLAVAPLAAALLMAGCSEPITCPTGPDGECQGTRKADQITGTIGVDQIYALGGDDSVQGGDGLGQRLQPSHLPPPVLNVVVEAISRADTFASNVLGQRNGARGDDLIKGGLGADYVKGGSGADAMYGGDGDDKAGGGPGNDTLYGGAGNERLSGGEDEIDCGLGFDTVVSYDKGLDVLEDCENATPSATTQPIARGTNLTSAI
jgi:Ca2+-binding RTX toxin-like protein